MNTILSKPDMKVYDVSGIITSQSPGATLMRSERIHQSVEALDGLAAIDAVLRSFPNSEFGSIPVVNDVTDQILDLSRCACLPCVQAATMVLDNGDCAFGCCDDCAERMSEMNSDNKAWIASSRQEIQA